jgi:acetaldehyde dehydrogenase
MCLKRPRQRSSDPATSAPTCCTSCCARSGWNPAGWSASTRTAKAWRGRASSDWRPPTRAWTGCWPGDEKPDLLFEATSAYVHKDAAPRYAEAGIRAIDLTPAAVGPAVIPPANLREHLDAPNVNLITCGGQATIPVVYAVSRVVDVPYAEIVASVASASAGPGTRANIDEFTKTTSKGVETIGGAQRGKAIIIINPADPPMIMRDTIFCAIPEDADRDAIAASIHDVVAEVQTYVPGYRLLNEPQFDEPSLNSGGRALVTTFIEVEGAGDYLPPYARNLDIMTAAATKVGEEIAKESLTATAGGQA